MTEKEDLFEPFKKYKKLSKKSKKIVDTTIREHGRAYDTATSLIEDEEGNIDYEKLEDPVLQEKFAEKMADHYVSKAKQVLKSKISGKDKFENAMLTQAYAGTAEHELKQIVGELGSKFTYDVYNKEIKDNFVKKIASNLKSAAKSHIKEEHIPHVVKYTKTEEFIDPNKLTIDDAVDILDEFHTQGVVSPEKHKNKIYSIKKYYKKEKEKEEEEEKEYKYSRAA